MNEQASTSSIDTPADQPGHSPTQAPYPGLRPYREDEQDNFFGREADCKILIDKILVNRLTLLFAATGVGKSSLLQAAVIPQLKSPRGENLDVVYYNDWISNPLVSLKQAVRQALEDSGSWQSAVHYMPAEDETLADFLRFCALFTRQPLIVVLDQFEEFFRYQKGRAVFEPFLQQVTSVFSDHTLPVHLVFSMREDFALELDAFKQYVPLSVFDNLYRLDKLRRKQAKEAILLPLEPTGYHYEPALLEQLLNDLLSRELHRDGHNPLADQTESVEPPYLQIVCSQLWELECGKADHRDGLLRLKTYQSAGGAKGLLENYIGKVLEAFSEPEKVLASRAFDHLISRDGAKMPYKTVDLAEATGAAETELEKVLVKLAEARILRSQSREGKIWYELYHDMFSGSIEGWNSQQKEKMRNRRMVIIGGSVLAGLLVTYFGTVAYVHSVSHHLRLAPGDDNRVEIFTGKQGWPDPFGQQRFYAETRLLSREIEPDKRFLQRGVLDYSDINNDLIAYRPLEERVSAYVYSGNYAKSIELFNKAIESVGQQANAVVRGLFSMKTLLSFQKIRSLAVSDKNKAVNKMALTLFEENTNALHIESLDEFRIYGQAFDGIMSGSINTESVKTSPLLFYKLLSYLNDSRPDTSTGAAQALGQIGDSAAVLALTQSLSDDDAGVRFYAASALGQIGDSVAIPALTQALSDDDAGVRFYAASALGQIGDSVAIPALTQALSDGNKNVRRYAASALGQIGDPVAIPELVQALGDDNQDVRQHAAEALGQIGDSEAIPALVQALGDAHEGVRYYVASTLVQIDNSAAVSHFIQALGDDDYDIRRYAASVFGRISDSSSLKLLVQALGDDNYLARSSAANAFERIGNSSAIPYLVQALDDTNEVVREAAALALGGIGDSVSLPALVQVLGDDNESVRGAAAYALGQIGDSASLPALVQALGDDNQGVRSLAASAIGGIGGSVSLPALVQALSDDNDDVRASAAYALGATGNSAALKPLVKALGDDNRNVRQFTAEALGQIGDSSVTPRLIQTLGDEDNDVKLSAVSALGRIGDSCAIDHLVQVLGDNNEDIRLNAAEVLGRIGNLTGIKYKKRPLIPTGNKPSERYRWSDYYNGGLITVDGKREHRQQLLAALNLSVLEARDQVLLQLARNPHAHISIRQRAINVLGKEGVNKQQIAVELRNLKPEQAPLKRTVKAAVTQLTTKSAPQKVSKITNLSAKDLPELKNQLVKLEQAHTDWRNFRDSKTNNDFTGENKEEQWDAFLQQVEDKKSAIKSQAAFHTVEALSQLDPSMGLELLRHPLADARQGAYTAFMMKANIDWLDKLDQAREQNRDDPIFRHAAFRAIDLGLRRLESLGNKDNDDQEYKQLKKWQDRLENDKTREQDHIDAGDTYKTGEDAGKPVDEVLERIQWTTLMMAHTKKMTAKYAKDGWVRDWPENALPVNQPYPDLAKD